MRLAYRCKGQQPSCLFLYCVYVYVYMCGQFRDLRTVSGVIKIGSDVCLYTPVSPSVPEMEGIYDTADILF